MDGSVEHELAHQPGTELGGEVMCCDSPPESVVMVWPSEM